MTIDPYLNFNGNCKEAMETYARVLDGTVSFMMSYAESPMAEQTPPEWRDKIMHATLMLPEGRRLMASDSPPPHFEPAQGMYISIGLSDPEKGKRIFDALAEGGQVKMPYEKTFWAKGFGMAVDRFGTPWMINCE